MHVLYTLLVAVAFFASTLVAHAAPKAAMKEWAFLTFLNGFNNLDQFGYEDMNEMEQVGSTARVHVISQWASLKTKEVHRIYVNQDSDPTTVTSPVVENLGRIDMGDYRNLIEFVRWSVKNYPAKQYFINIWNHGSGWHRLSGIPGPRDVSYDDLSGNKITTEQLGIAVAEISRELGHKIDIMGSDSCLMAMGEVVGQMKDGISNFIGSEEVEPAPGWPYGRLLTAWNSGAEKTPADIAKILTQVYVDSYGGTGQLTLSGMDMSRYDELASAVREFGAAIKSQPTASRKKIFQAMTRTQSYTTPDYKDLGDLVDQISMDTTVLLPPNVLLGVKDALKKFVIANKTSITQARSQGVAIWFPDSTAQYNSYKGRYKNLIFNQDTAWIDAVQSTLSASTL